ncbi:MAG TPA: DegT/DnrJ/EryC1/StrS family aminotransferase [Gemmatimonadales bacterium]|nr:DegT/DnrJ/EryC1/StrS family aminotransferase [Gemmatimonadales bacterium]
MYSPLSLGALAGGVGAALSGGGSAKARVDAWIRERYGARQVLLTDSGTSALALAMQAAVRRSPGKPILLPSYGCYDLVTAAMAAGVEVGWYDIEPTNLQPDLGARGAPLPDAAAIVVVHHWGIPADISRLRALLAAGAHSAPLVIEDAAQAIGGSVEGRPLGGFGDLSVLSFGRGKGMTGGGGGALLAIGREAADLVDGLASDVRSAERGGGSLVSTGAQWLLARPALYGVPASLPFLQLGATVFRAPHPPRKMSAASAGVLARTIPLQEAEAQGRGRNASRLLRSAGDWSIPVTGPAARAGYLRLPVLLPEAVAPLRDSPEARRLGIMPGYPIPLPVLPGSPFPGTPAPGAAMLAARLVTLPVHSLLRETDLARIELVLKTWRRAHPAAATGIEKKFDKIT